MIAPDLLPRREFNDPDAALAHARAIYDAGVVHLRKHLQAFLDGDVPGERVRATYPFVRVRINTVARADSRLSYGFAAGPGRFETTLTRPDLFARYYREQFRLLLRNHAVALEIGASEQPIPVHFSLAEDDHLEGTLTPQRRLLMRDLFDLPDLASMDDGIANGTYEPGPGEAQPLALFTAARVDYSLHRLRHYTGTAPEHFQNFVLFTNYQFYIDEFIRLGHELMADAAGEYAAFVEPGNVVTRRAGTPADAARHGGRGAAPAAADAGLPSGAAGRRRHHDGQHRRRPGQCQDHHRPHRGLASACLDHARPLRRLAQYAAPRRLRAGPWLRARRPCARRRTAAVGADSRPGRGSGGARTRGRRRHAALGLRAEAAAAHRHRGLDRQPQLGVAAASGPRAPIQPEPGRGTGHGVAPTIAANGFRFRVPYGTLLCVSDKPLHGEIKLPGMANQFYRERVDQHLRIGMRAIELLRAAGGDQLHSRKLRSFAEVAFQ